MGEQGRDVGTNIGTFLLLSVKEIFHYGQSTYDGVNKI